MKVLVTFEDGSTTAIELTGVITVESHNQYMDKLSTADGAAYFFYKDGRYDGWESGFIVGLSKEESDAKIREITAKMGVNADAVEKLLKAKRW
jgi:hypothetical protein